MTYISDKKLNNQIFYAYTSIYLDDISFVKQVKPVYIGKFENISLALRCWCYIKTEVVQTRWLPNSDKLNFNVITLNIIKL